MRISLDRIMAAINESNPPSQESFLGEFLLLEKPEAKEANQLNVVAQPDKKEEDPNALLWLALQTRAIQQTINDHKQQCAKLDDDASTDIVKATPAIEIGEPIATIAAQREPQVGLMGSREPIVEEAKQAQPIEPADGAPRAVAEIKPQHAHENKLHALRREVSSHEAPELTIAPKREELAAQREPKLELTPIPKEVEEVKHELKQTQELSTTERTQRESEPAKQAESKSAELRTNNTTYEPSQAPQRVQLVIGEGEQQVKLSIATSEHQVKVFTQSAPPELMRSMQSSVSELQSALQQHGLNLSHFGSDKQQHEPREREQPEDEPQKASAPSLTKRARAIL